MSRNKKRMEALQRVAGLEKVADTFLGVVESTDALVGLSPTDGAVIIERTNNKFYIYDETSGWSQMTGGSGISDVVDDTTPQLGGDLDLNSNNIIGTGNITTTGNITISGEFGAGGPGTFDDTLDVDSDLTVNGNFALGGNMTSFGYIAGGLGGSLNSFDLDGSAVITSDLTLVAGNLGVTLGNIVLSTGNITVAGTVDGRDVAADGTKLDTIESNADVTDEANVLASLSGATTTPITPAAGDKILALDASDSDNIKHILFSEFGSGVSDHGGLTGLGDDDHTQYAIISSDAGAPASTPPRVGAIYVDTTADVVYIAVDTSASTDWQEQVVVDGTDLADGEILIWDAGNNKFVRDNREVVTTAVTTINMNSMMGSYYGTTTACTASSYTLANAKAGGRATIRIQNATSGGPSISGTGITVSKKGDWSTNYDTTNVNTIFIEMVNATTAWCWITAVD